MKRLLSIVSVLVLLGGCQTTQPVAKSTGLENTAFMRLWTTYSECRSSTDLGATRTAARQLNQAVATPTANKDFVLPLPKQNPRPLGTPRHTRARAEPRIHPGTSPPG